MTTRFYPAVIEPGNEGYSVYFPDLPGCTSGGDTVQQAAANAIEALALHVSGMAEDGETIPEPSAPEAIEVPRGHTLIMVPVDMPGRVVRISMTMDENTLALADRIAAARGTTRSGLFAEFVRREAAGPIPVVAFKPRRDPAVTEAWLDWIEAISPDDPSGARLIAIGGLMLDAFQRGPDYTAKLAENLADKFKTLGLAAFDGLIGKDKVFDPLRERLARIERGEMKPKRRIGKT